MHAVAETLGIPKTPGATTVYFAFGRFQPPTIGHRKVFQVMKDLATAAGGDYFIVPSHSCDAVQTFLDIDTPAGFAGSASSASAKKCAKPKNPLNLIQKLYFLKAMYPADASHVLNIDHLAERYAALLKEAGLEFPSPKTFATVAQALFLCGYKRVYLVVGSDEYESLLLLDPQTKKRRKGTEKKSTFVESIRASFEKLRGSIQLPEAVFALENAGQRLETASGAGETETVASMSGTKMREAVAACRYAEFRRGIPESLAEPECKRLFRILRKALGASASASEARMSEARGAPSPCEASLMG